ncbi:hypothetical protein SAMN05216403_10852 [Nitrosospira multiformis ATCC 25196]|uniref:Uncharacterized protein n=2 Tax=Nitrosospira multiformis TaxID=1231 RepID=A0A1H5UM41_NITMU|nr:hypothetical protein SAMN05216403_10852 [Nitrosospira multiformis ATCC 25196]
MIHRLQKLPIWMKNATTASAVGCSAARLQSSERRGLGLWLQSKMFEDPLDHPQERRNDLQLPTPQLGQRCMSMPKTRLNNLTPLMQWFLGGC